MKYWNKKKLEEMYYTGLTSGMIYSLKNTSFDFLLIIFQEYLDFGKKTKHNWGIKNLGSSELSRLEAAKDRWEVN